MKNTTLLLALTAANLFLLVALPGQSFGVARAEGDATILRGRGLQIVDEQGRVRASISVLPSAPAADAAVQGETVLLRLITERGRPSVKISASEQGSGLSVVGPTGTKDTYAILEARQSTSALRVRSEDGKERSIQP